MPACPSWTEASQELPKEHGLYPCLTTQGKLVLAHFHAYQGRWEYAFGPIDTMSDIVYWLKDCPAKILKCYTREELHSWLEVNHLLKDGIPHKIWRQDDPAA
jgi:hypothetical protein